MRSIENETRLTINTRRNFVNYATMTLSDGTVLNLTPSDFRISGQSFTDDWSDGESFQIGSAIGKTATLLLDNTDGRTEEIGSSVVTYTHGKFSQYDFYMAYFTLYVCLPDAYTYGSSIRDQMIPIGIFTVTTPVANSSTIEITGVDNMYMFDKSFDDCTLNFETSPTLQTILNRCCQDCGVAIGYTTFDNETMTVSEKPENVTYRQVVSWIAQIAGCNAVIDENGALRLKWYDMSAFASWLDGGTFNTTTTPYSDGDVADGGDFNPWNTGYIADGGGFTDPLPFHNLKNVKSTQVSTDEIHFTGVVVKHDETEVHYPDSAGWDTYALEITENPFVAGNESEIAQDTYNKLSGLIIRPFTCSSLQDPTIEAGDCALVYDTKGNTFPTLITNVKFTTGGYTEVNCKAESPIKQNARYINPAAQAVVQAEKKMDDYNKQVAHFNSLANDALGYYQTEQVDPETGSTILYVHDAPTLANSQYIWKITSTGIFISEDGGQSYNSGVDTSTATMLMNLIYAKGIVADWIHAGTLTLGGDNNTNGVCSVLDVYGVEKVRLDKSGITVKNGTIDGTAITSEAANASSKVTISGGLVLIEDSPSMSLSVSNKTYPSIYSLMLGSTYVTVICMDGTMGAGQVTEKTAYLGWAIIDAKSAHSSDRRLKKNICDISKEESKSIIRGARPRYFEFKKSMEGGVRSGFIAQELRETLDDIGNDTAIERQSVRRPEEREVIYEDFIAHLVNTVQDLYSEIDSLKQRIDQLESIVNTK